MGDWPVGMEDRTLIDLTEANHLQQFLTSTGCRTPDAYVFHNNQNPFWQVHFEIFPLELLMILRSNNLLTEHCKDKVTLDGWTMESEGECRPRYVPVWTGARKQYITYSRLAFETLACKRVVGNNFDEETPRKTALVKYMGKSMCTPLLERLDSKAFHFIHSPPLTSCLQSLSTGRKDASLSLFCRCYISHCFRELLLGIPPLLHRKCAHQAFYCHPFCVRIS